MQFMASLIQSLKSCGPTGGDLPCYDEDYSPRTETQYLGPMVTGLPLISFEELRPEANERGRVDLRNVLIAQWICQEPNLLV